MGLPTTNYSIINWRAGSNTYLSSRFAAVRVRTTTR
jgi:SRSO17 transposase